MIGRSLFLLLFAVWLSFGSHASPLPSEIKKPFDILSPYRSQIQARLEANSSLIQDIHQQLKNHQLPPSLALLPMLESSFDPRAVSHAKAVGLWQLIPATAERFGLDVGKHNDQRYDPELSTAAATQYLAFLYEKFGDLTLTLAAYNAGEGRVARAIKRAGNAHFPDLALPKETQQYVRRFYALMKLVDITKLHKTERQRFFLFGQTHSTPLIDLGPLPPLVTL